MLYTGLDYHRSFSYLTTMNEKGEIITQEKLPSNGEIICFLRSFGQSVEVSIEATPSWYWLHDQLEDKGFEVKLSHRLKTKAIAYAKVKTDKVDSATHSQLSGWVSWLETQAYSDRAWADHEIWQDWKAGKAVTWKL